MANRFEINPRRIFGPRQRVAYNEAKKKLEAGANCDDCMELHNTRWAISFVIEESPQEIGGDTVFFVSFLCQYHADCFILKKDASGVFVNGKKVLN